MQVVTTKVLQKSAVKNCHSRRLKGWHILILPKMDIQHTYNGLYVCVLCAQKVSVTF